MLGLCLAYPHTLGTNLEESTDPDSPSEIAKRLGKMPSDTAQEFSSTGTELPVLH